VLDWDAARSGAREGDVAWFRIHLALTGPDGVADAFADDYVAAAARPLANLPHWDARAAALAVGRHPFWLPLYRAGGLEPEYDDVRRRLVDFIARCGA
jgi:hypothetical protein